MNLKAKLLSNTYIHKYTKYMYFRHNIYNNLPLTNVCIYIKVLGSLYIYIIKFNSRLFVQRFSQSSFTGDYVSTIYLTYGKIW